MEHILIFSRFGTRKQSKLDRKFLTETDTWFYGVLSNKICGGNRKLRKQVRLRKRVPKFVIGTWIVEHWLNHYQQRSENNTREYRTKMK